VRENLQWGLLLEIGGLLKKGEGKQTVFLLIFEKGLLILQCTVVAFIGEWVATRGFRIYSIKPFL
jgi:hypothetical protein